MESTVLLRDKFQELTSVNFGVQFLARIIAHGCTLKNCSFHAYIHFDNIKLEIVISLVDKSLTIETFNEETFVRNKNVAEFLENATNFNNLMNGLIDYCKISGLLQIRCLTDNEIQENVLSSLGFFTEEDGIWQKYMTPIAKVLDSYDLMSLRESLKLFGLDLTNVFFAATMDFGGSGTYAGQVGRIEYRYRLIKGTPMVSIFDAMDLIGLKGVTHMFKEYLEQSYGVQLEIIM